jgi:hypothetical protein
MSVFGRALRDLKPATRRGLVTALLNKESAALEPAKANETAQIMIDLTSSNRAPTDFTPAEWLALFPWPLNDANRGLPSDEGDQIADPAATLRVSNALTADSFGRALAPWPNLRRFAEAQRSQTIHALAGTKSGYLVRLAVELPTVFALSVFLVAESNGRFGAKQTATFGATFLVSFLIPDLLTLWSLPWTKPAYNYLGDPLAGFIRWSQLVWLDRGLEKKAEETVSNRSGSVLLQHWAGGFGVCSEYLPCVLTKDAEENMSSV